MSVPDKTQQLIDTLLRERDEARREVCLLKSYNYENTITPKGYAELRKWDCFATLQIDNPALDRLAELDDEIESKR